MSDPRERPQSINLCAFLFIACLLLSGIAAAARSITLSKRSGPPTSGIAVSGRGFQPNVGVDIFFDTKDKALIVTNGEGEFQDVRIHVPRTAHPGKHWVTALERDNQKGAQEPFLVQTDWSQFHFDADGTRVNPYENLLNPKTVGNLDLNWSYKTDSGVDSGPAVVDGVVYVDASGMLALDARTGALLWTSANGGGSSPAVSHGVVYVGCAYSLCALNARTGALLWSYETDDVVDSSPSVVDGVVYVGSAEGSLYAFNAATGALLWSYYGGGVTCSPAVANGVVFFGTDGGNVYALNASTGAELWNYAIYNGDYVASSPAVANGVVYFGGEDSNVYALNASTGALVWRYMTSNEIISSPAVAGGVVYVGSWDGNVYALRASTGSKLWSYATGNHVESSPAVANGVVYIGSGYPNSEMVYALDARTGALLWNYSTGGYVYSSPAVANGMVYVGSDDGNVYAFGLPRGDEAEQEAASTRPALNMLHPDFNLKPSIQSR